MNPASAVPDDADDLRGFHFRQLLGKPLTWIAARDRGRRRRGSPLLSSSGRRSAPQRRPAPSCSRLLIVFAIADSHSEDAFFEVYADSSAA